MLDGWNCDISSCRNWNDLPENAKKYIESGMLKGHGKKSPAHKAAVTGDTVGDTRKDVVGVALDIFIKTMSTVANTLVSVFSRFTLLK